LQAGLRAIELILQLRDFRVANESHRNNFAYSSLCLHHLLTAQQQLQNKKTEVRFSLFLGLVLQVNMLKLIAKKQNFHHELQRQSGLLVNLVKFEISVLLDHRGVLADANIVFDSCCVKKQL
jgi:hypothetical protein